MRLALAILLLVPALAFGQARDDKKDDKVSNDDPGRPLQMPPASTETKEALEDFERFQRRGAWERALKSLFTIPDDQARAVRQRRQGLHHPGRAEAARDPRSAAAGRPGGLPALLRLRGQEAARRRRGRIRAEEPRAGLLGVLHHVGRRQRRRSAGRPVLRAGSVRPRGRLLALGAARAARHGPLARAPGGEGRRGARPLGASVRIRAGPRRAGGPLPRREGDDRRPHGHGRRDAPPAAHRGREGRHELRGPPHTPTRRGRTSPARSTQPGGCASPTRSRPA